MWDISDTNTDWKFVHRRFFCWDGEKRWCGYIVWLRQNDIFYILLYFLLHLRSECCAEGAMSVVIGKV